METKLKETLQNDRDPVYELLDIAKEILDAPDCLRAIVLFSLSYLSFLNFTFLTNNWYESFLAGTFVNVYQNICTIMLMLTISVSAFFYTSSLVIVTWEHTKKGHPAILSEFMNRLIGLLCIYIAIGFLIASLRLSGTLVPIIMFYGVSIVLLDGIGQIRIAKMEIKAYDQDIEFRRRVHNEY